LRESRFGAPRDEGQNEEGGPHRSLHRVLHSRESCRSLPPHPTKAIFQQELPKMMAESS
jgi:hypothetical protein